MLKVMALPMLHDVLTNLVGKAKLLSQAGTGAELAGSSREDGSSRAGSECALHLESYYEGI